MAGYCKFDVGVTVACRTTYVHSNVREICEYERGAIRPSGTALRDQRNCTLLLYDFTFIFRGTYIRGVTTPYVRHGTRDMVHTCGPIAYLMC